MSQETTADTEGTDVPETPADAATPSESKAPAREPRPPEEAEPQESDFDEKILSCGTCGEDFRFSAGEQAFFAQRGFQPPRHCKPCRTKRRESGGAERRPRRSGGRPSGGRPSGGRPSGGRPSGGRSGGGRPSGGRAAASDGDKPAGERKRWPAICAECAIETTVPFEPRGTKPLLCPDCYRDPRRM